MRHTDWCCLLESDPCLILYCSSYFLKSDARAKTNKSRILARDLFGAPNVAQKTISQAEDLVHRCAGNALLHARETVKPIPETHASVLQMESIAAVLH